MNYVSICSGIEAATVAWHPLGWTPLAFSEIEDFPSAVLAHHYPSVPNFGDMTKFHGWDVETLAQADILVGGTPCQAFSVAGLRAGLDDARGKLTITYIRLLDYIDEVRSLYGKQPAICVWENVPGVLSSKDNAFGAFLGGLVGEDSELIPAGGKWTDAGCVYGPKRSVAWRVLDAQYFGLAQRRRRVFVVASAGDIDPSEILFEFDGVRRDTPPSREKGESIAPTVTNGPPFSRTGNERVECDAIVPCVFREGSFGQYVENEFGTCKASGGVLGGGSETFVAFHPTQDPIHSSDGTTHSLGCGSSNGQSSIAVACIGGQHPNAAICEDGSAPTLTHQNLQVRRLTPTECERLQGFPDGYTAIPWKTYQEAVRKGLSYETLLHKRGMRLRGCTTEECPDGPRYKALGNSMAVPVMRWIGERVSNAVRMG